MDQEFYTVLTVGYELFRSFSSHLQVIFILFLFSARCSLADAGFRWYPAGPEPRVRKNLVVRLEEADVTIEDGREMGLACWKRFVPTRR